MVALSASTYLPAIVSIFGIMCTGAGFNAILRPKPALSLIGWLEYKPASPLDKKVIDTLILIYSMRDIYMDLAEIGAAYYNNVQVLGSVMIAGSAVAFADGAICRKMIGHSQGSHWILASIMTAFGAVCLVLLDC